MLNAKQIAAILRDTDTIEAAAVKIAELVKPDYTIHTAAAALENEVTSTLLDMLAATILATLIEQEGGGRTNIQFSPGGMQELLSRWNYTVEHDGLVRTVRISAKSGAWEPTEDSPADAKFESLIASQPAGDNLKPQAPEHEYNRPVWVVACNTVDDGTLVFSRQLDRKMAEQELRRWPADTALASNAHIENRWCYHVECPASGCNYDTTLRDEVSSD